MTIFCPNCGKAIVIPAHLEAEAAHKCPACGTVFGAAPEPAEKKEEGPSTQDIAVNPFRISRGDTMWTPVSKIQEAAARQAAGQAAAPQRAPKAPKAPEIIADVDVSMCELAEERARAGSGILYNAIDRQTGNKVLVKAFLPPPGIPGDEPARWANASVKMKNFRLAGTLPVLGVGLIEGVPAIVVQSFDGPSLASGIEKQKIRGKKGMSVVLQTLDVLDAAHRAGIVHGNLKPSNILLGPRSAPVLTDFGQGPTFLDPISHLVDSDHVDGSLPYAAPEVVLQGPSAVSVRSDIYSVGAILYEVLTGWPPFAEKRGSELADAIANEMPPPPSKVGKKIHPSLDAICLKALEKNPEERFRFSHEMSVELQRYLHGARTHAERELKEKRKGGPLKKLAIFLLLILLGVAGFEAYRRYSLRRRKGNASEMLRKASLLADRGEKEKALEMMADAEKTARSTGLWPEAAFHYGKQLVSAGDFEAAVSVLEDVGAVSDSPFSAPARMWLEVARALAGPSQEPLAGLTAMLEAASKGTPGTADAGVVRYGIIFAASRLAQINRHSEAAAFARTITACDNTSEEESAKAHLLVVESLVALGKPAEARQELQHLTSRTAKKVSPSVVPILDRAAGVLADLLAAERIAPTRPERALIARSSRAMIRLADAFLQSNTAFAKEWYGKVVEKHDLLKGQETEPGVLDAWRTAAAEASLHLGHIALLDDNVSYAKKRYSDVEHPLHGTGRVLAEALVGLGDLALAREGGASDAIGWFERVEVEFIGMEDAAPSRADAILGRAASMRVTAAPASALKVYTRLLEQFPQLPTQCAEALAGRGETYLEMGQADEARAAFAQLSKRYSDTSPELAVIAGFVAGKETLQDIDREVQTRPWRVRAHAFYSIALKLERDGHLVEAVKHYEKCITDSRNSVWYKHLAARRIEAIKGGE